MWTRSNLQVQKLRFNQSDYFVVLPVRMCTAAPPLKKNHFFPPAAAIIMFNHVTGRYPFTKKFRKFRLGCKWNTTFWFVPLEITDFSSLLFLSPVPDLSRSFKRPGVPRLPRMELVANGTRSSQTETPNRNFPKVFVNGKKTKQRHSL